MANIFEVTQWGDSTWFNCKYIYFIPFLDYVLNIVGKNGTLADKNFKNFWPSISIDAKNKYFLDNKDFSYFLCRHRGCNIIPKSGNICRVREMVSKGWSFTWFNTWKNPQNRGKRINQRSEEDTITKEGAFKENHVQMLHKKWFGTRNVTA